MILFPATDSPFNTDNRKEVVAGKLGGYLGDDVDLQASEGGGNSASTSRDERDAEDRRAVKSGGGSGGAPPSPGQTLPRTFSQERKGLQKYVSLPADAAVLAQSGTSSAGIAHLQGLQPLTAETTVAAPSTSAGPNKGGLATTSTGLAALARAGKLFNTNCVFDLEVSSKLFRFTLSYHHAY